MCSQRLTKGRQTQVQDTEIQLPEYSTTDLEMEEMLSDNWLAILAITVAGGLVILTSD